MNIKNLTMTFGTQEIFDDINLQIKEKEKVGIIGVNGAGKSTFFKLILGKLEPDRGKIILKPGTRIGFLPQVISDEIPSMEISVFDYLLDGRPIKKLEKELSEAYTEASIESDEKKLKIIMKKIGKLQEKLEYYEVYNAENILLKIVTGMNIDSDLLDMKLCDLSGGQKSKIAFARLLYSNPEILLLDEPTNHLDNDSKDYIIQYLKHYNGTVLVISHDIEFLDQVTTQTLYVDKITHKMELFPGNYEKYIKIRNERLKTQERIYDKQIKEEEKLKRIIAKYIGGNEKKARIAKDRQKKLARLEENKITLEKKQKVTHFKIKINHQSGIIPLKCENLTFGYNENHLLINDLTFDLSRGEKFLVVGENGVGKSTLLKLIMGYLKPLSGELQLNDKTELGYYAQEHELLDNEKIILENFSEFSLSTKEIRSFLGNFLFSGDDVYKKVAYLSPGERSRVALAKLALTGANLLILDEPTNHLDPQTQEIIAQTFKDYEGTMLVVSHNVDFVDNLGIERMLMLPSGEIKYYDKDTVLYYQELNNQSKYKKKIS
ncbi:MAG TPA: ABC-F family ATP-binding cassette domain-containing protein [Candidatus Coprovivens excrementavium]|nr:ABC-F family ATP-binding cassette domain-containing protein [Candidatus Coprovivens excrementavium]